MLDFLENKIPAPWQESLSRVAFALWGSVTFVGLVFSLRGMAGAFRQEVSTLAACFGASIAAVACLAALGCYRAATPGGLTPKQTLLALALTVLPPTVLGIVLCPSGSSAGIAWITIWGVGLTTSVQLVAKAVASSDLSEEAEATPAAAFSLPLAEPDLTQWMTRRTLSQEGESWEQIEGRSRVEFAGGQQHATMHLSICPPLSSAPEIECEVPGDAEIEWKVTAVHPYGVRLELRRPAPIALPLSVAVSYTMAAPIQTSIAKAA